MLNKSSAGQCATCSILRRGERGRWCCFVASPPKNNCSYSFLFSSKAVLLAAEICGAQTFCLWSCDRGGRRWISFWIQPSYHLTGCFCLTGSLGRLCASVLTVDWVTTLPGQHGVQLFRLATSKTCGRSWN